MGFSFFRWRSEFFLISCVMVNIVLKDAGDEKKSGRVWPWRTESGVMSRGEKLAISASIQR